MQTDSQRGEDAGHRSEDAGTAGHEPDAATEQDAGWDAAARDAGEPDDGDAALDAGQDGMGLDSGVPDSGQDAGQADAGQDAAEPDAGQEDAAEPDAGQDAAEPDAGEDAGQPDGGSPCDKNPPPCRCPEKAVIPDDNGCTPPLCEIDKCAPDSECSFLRSSSGDYYLCLNERTWSQARARCEAKLMHLAGVDDGDEDAYLFSKIADKTWVGGSDAQNEGTWMWPDGTAFYIGDEDEGTAVDDAYLNWDPVEPNNAGLGAGQADCMILWSQNGTWADATCQDEHGYICEVK